MTNIIEVNTNEQVISKVRSISANELYKSENYEALKWFIKSKVNYNNEVAEEIIQDTFIKFMDKYSKGFDASKAKLKTVLNLIANNLIKDYYRSINAKKRISDQVSIFNELEENFTILDTISNDSKTDSYIINEQRSYFLNQAIQNALNQNEAIYLKEFYLNELKIDEIAEQYNVPVNTIKVTLSRARTKLANYLKINSQILINI